MRNSPIVYFGIKNNLNLEEMLLLIKIIIEKVKTYNLKN